MKHLLASSLCILAIGWVAAGCTSEGFSGSGPAKITVMVTPSTPSVRAGSSQQFTASITGSSNTSVSWTVNGVAGGNSTLGTIDATGMFQAPATLPSPNSVSVQATSVADATAQATTTVTLLNPVPALSGISPASIPVGSFSITVTGSDFVQGAQVMFGTAALTTTFGSATQLTATGTATASEVGSVMVTVQNPDPGSVVSTTSEAAMVTATQTETASAAVRFLEQSTFGPTPQLITQVEASGFSAFLKSQFAASGSTYPDPASTVTSITPTQQVFFTNALNNSDQLRQRVAFALSQIWVTSNFTVPPQGMAPYMRLLLQDAFGNYRTLMNDVSLSPAMGLYLNMVDNDKPGSSAAHANENYARESMQLFTLGLNLLNDDGTPQLDSSGNPIPTYTQAQVQAFARAYTGWTYPTQSGQTLQKHNPQYFIGPMVPYESNHDEQTKAILLGTTLPAGQTAEQDLAGALDNVFSHPNVGPFVSQQLIQHLVTSNPSPAYVKRVADVFASGSFNGFGSGQRGDMQAVIAAILLDPEARANDDPTQTVTTEGHLREPILYITNLLSAFGATSDGAAPVNYATSMSEAPLRSPSVFNFFPPNYQIPGASLLGPEFDLQTTATALVRINFINSLVYSSIGTGTTVSFATYTTLASNPGQLVDALNALLLHGTMSSSTRSAILTAVNAVPTGTNQNLQRAQAAIYLIASSSQYQVEY
jgi:uncharacterized protein (DUF1800 family)